MSYWLSRLVLSLAVSSTLINFMFRVQEVRRLLYMTTERGLRTVRAFRGINSLIPGEMLNPRLKANVELEEVTQPWRADFGYMSIARSLRDLCST